MTQTNETRQYVAGRTLSHWRDRFSGTPVSFDCPHMVLWGNDTEGEIFSGPGRIELTSPTDARFVMQGTPKDQKAAMVKYNEAKSNPYEARSQFRLIATDFDGVEWNCGFLPVHSPAQHENVWQLTGEFEALLTEDKGFWVAEHSGVELLFVPPIDIPMDTTMEIVATSESEIVSHTMMPGKHEVDVLGTKIQFFADPNGDAMLVVADTNEHLNHPYLENWLSEPFRILLGGSFYPRMVARNFGDGRASVWVRPSPRRELPSAIGLRQPFLAMPPARMPFWDAYCLLLKMIASAGEFDAHPVTALYEEISETMYGSRWVLTMSLASAAETLANRLMTDADRKSEYPDDEIDSLKKHIKAWSGDVPLRNRLLSNFGNLKSRSVLSFMRVLTERGIVETPHVTTWRSIRNSVMHGEMVAPWSTQESDMRLQQMLDLVHDLTWAVIENEQPND